MTHLVVELPGQALPFLLFHLRHSGRQGPELLFCLLDLRDVGEDSDQAADAAVAFQESGFFHDDIPLAAIMPLRHILV